MQQKVEQSEMGRPLRYGQPCRSISVSIPKDAIAELDRRRQLVSRSSYVAAIILAHLAEDSDSTR